MRSLFVLIALTAKRLLLRPVFWCILLLIPLSAVSLSSAAGDGGVFTAAVCTEKDSDFSAALADLEKTSRVVRVRYYDSPEAARLALTEGSADAAWIFHGSLKEMARDYLDRNGKTHIQILYREGGVFQTMARERLFSAIFSPVGKEVFFRAVQKLSLTPPLGEEEIASFYDYAVQSEEVVRFETLGGEKTEPENVLLSPLRGMLAVVILAGALASAVLFAEDETAGLYRIYSPLQRGAFRFFSLFLPALFLSAAAFLSLTFARLVTNGWFEALLLFLYALSCAAFSLFALALFRRAKPLGFFTLFVLVASLILTPVFLDLSAFRGASLLLPSYHYLLSLKAPALLFRVPLYSGAFFAAAFALFFWKRKRSA